MTGKQPKSIGEVWLGYVYLVHCSRTGFFKIGSARRPSVRLKQLRSEMRSACVMLHTIATNHALRLEREAQSRFIEQHQGGEWFDLTSADIDTVMSVATVFYRDVERPKDTRRIAFDFGSKWAKTLPVCGGRYE